MMLFRTRVQSIRALSFLFITTALFSLNGCNSGSKGPPPMPPPEVLTLTVHEERAVLTTELPGRTSAFLMAEVRPQVSGIIRKRLFEEGSAVKAGDVLYQIESALFQAAYESAKASLTRSEANLPAVRARAERYRELLAAKAVSQQDVDDVSGALRQIEADVTYWKAAVSSARINLEYTRILAPISGRIGKSNVTEGALVSAHQPLPLAIIQQFDPIYVYVPQSTVELQRLKRRMEAGLLNESGTEQKKVRLLLDDGAVYPLEGVLQFRDITVDPSTGAVTLRAVFPNPDEMLLPGMFVRALLQEGINGQALFIPQQAVSRDPKGNAFVLLVDDESKVQMRSVMIDRAIGDRYLISTGLVAGDRVIVEGGQNLRPGVAVKPIASNDGESNADASGNTAMQASTPK